MKNRDIYGDSPSGASDQMTAKIAKNWEPFGIKDFKNERAAIMKSKWFRLEASEDEKKGILLGIKVGWNLSQEGMSICRKEIKRILEWKKRTNADDDLLSESFKKIVLKK